MAEVHKISRKQEERMAAAIGGRRTPGSGNTWSRKNDVRSDDLSMELKITAAKQYPLKASELEQGEKHAIVDSRDFAFAIEMCGRTWVVISEEDFLTYREALKSVTDGS